MLGGLLTKLYLLVGAGLIVGYLSMEARGAIFSGTDKRPSVYSARSSGGRSGGGSSGGGGVFFFGSGYRGGK